MDDLTVCMEIYTKQLVFQKIYFEMLLKAIFSYSSDELVSIWVYGVLLQLLD